MREIKFRGKSIKTGEWVIGAHVVYGKYKKDHFIFVEGHGSNFISCFIAVDKKSVGQYSGLSDKNGKEIYDGDIVCAYDDSALFGMGKKHQGTIIYSGNCFSLECNGVCLDKWVNAEHIKIIGNIYEHPELLNSTE